MPEEDGTMSAAKSASEMFFNREGAMTWEDIAYCREYAKTLNKLCDVFNDLIEEGVVQPENFMWKHSEFNPENRKT